MYHRKKRSFAPLFVLQDNADKAAAALVDDSLERLRQLRARVVRHMGKLRVKSFVDQLIKRFAEHIGLPNLLRIGLELAQKEIDQLLGLLLGAHTRGNLRFDIRLDHMDARRRGADEAAGRACRRQEAVRQGQGGARRSGGDRIRHRHARSA